MKPLIFLCCFLIGGGSASAWGYKGHDIVTAIAAANLKPRAAKKLNAILEGHTLTYYSGWMDNIRKQEPYRHTATWHYANVDEGYTFETMPRNPAGDVVSALEETAAALRNGGLNDSVERTYVKFLIHLVGDLHCPMHAGHSPDRSGNLIPVTWFGKPTNLHAVWDDDIIEDGRRWSYTEWVENLDIVDRQQKAAMARGTFSDWIAETIAVSDAVYRETPVDGKLSYDYMQHFTPAVEQQLLKAGIRLAAILNDIYG